MKVFRIRLSIVCNPCLCSVTVRMLPYPFLELMTIHLYEPGVDSFLNKLRSKLDFGVFSKKGSYLHCKFVLFLVIARKNSKEKCMFTKNT